MNNFIFKKYVQFIERNGYFPMMFQPYNCSEIFDVSPTVTANCGSKTSSAAVLITNLGDEEMNKEESNKMMNKEMIKEHNRTAKHQQDSLQHKDDVCRCIPAGTHGSTPHLTKTVVSNSPLRIRKLTPKECFRLMGFDDEDFHKAEAVNSNTQLYKQAGNSIVVDVLEAIFTNLKPYLSERE